MVNQMRNLPNVRKKKGLDTDWKPKKFKKSSLLSKKRIHSK